MKRNIAVSGEAPAEVSGAWPTAAAWIPTRALIGWAHTSSALSTMYAVEPPKMPSTIKFYRNLYFIMKGSKYKQKTNKQTNVSCENKT